MTIYRLNRVPDKLHVTLLDLLGIRLDGPSAATTSLRFKLADQPTEPILISGGITEVGTPRTAHDESVITRTGEWLGRDWLRVNRGGDPHSGVLEREQRVKQLRVELAASQDNVREMQARLAACREALAAALAG